MKRVKMLYVMGLMLILQGMTWAGETSKRPMNFDDIFKFCDVRSPRLSTNGDYVAFTVTKYDWDKNGRITHVWRVPKRGGEAVQMTRGEKSCHSPRWSPDGKIISFLSNREDKTQIYFLRNDGGEAYKMTDFKSGISGYAWSHDGAMIYFTARDTLTAAEARREKRKDDAYLYEKNQKNMRIWEFDVKKKTVRKITDGKYSVRSWRLSPDGRKIAFIAAPSPIRDADINNEIYIINLGNLRTTKLTENNAIERSLEWAPDGTAITFISDSNENLETYHLESIFYLDLATGEIKDMLPGFEWQVYGHFWTKNNVGPIYFTANKGVTVQLFSLDPRTMKWKQLTDYAGVFSGVHYQKETDEVVFTRTDPQHPYEVYVADLAKLRIRQLTHLNPLADSLSLGKYEVIHWRSTDGVIVEGILIKPPHYDASRKYPLILQIHGGPESSYKLSFNNSYGTYSNILASKNYVLLQPNYRGSTGYGDDCMRAIIGHYFEKDWDDLMTGVDYVIDQGIVDADSLAVHGWSAGGHLTNWTITHTDRFKCAASGAGGANWYSFYAQTDMQYIREIWHDSSPYDNVEFWLQKSPISYIKDAKTPTLVFCGENDRRVPFPQSQELYRGLKRNGCPVEFVVFPRSGHGPSEMWHRMFKMKKEFSWFEYHIRGKEKPEDLDELK